MSDYRPGARQGPARPVRLRRPRRRRLARAARRQAAGARARDHARRAVAPVRRAVEEEPGRGRHPHRLRHRQVARAAEDGARRQADDVELGYSAAQRPTAGCAWQRCTARRSGEPEPVALQELPASTRSTSACSALPDGPERDGADARGQADLVAAYMPYKTHVHRIVTDLVHRWVVGYRARRCSATSSGTYVDVDDGSDADGREAVSGVERDAMSSPEPQILRYTRWLREQRGLRLRPDHDRRLRRASGAGRATTCAAFWQSIWRLLRRCSRRRRTTTRAGRARRCPARAGSPARRSTTRSRCSAMPTRRTPPAIRRSSSATRRCGARRDARDHLARAAPPGGVARARRCARMGVQPRRPGRAPSCRTCRRRRSPSSPAPASARSGRCARPTWGRWRCSTASARSSPRC